MDARNMARPALHPSRALAHSATIGKNPLGVYAHRVDEVGGPAAHCGPAAHKCARTQNALLPNHKPLQLRIVAVTVGTRGLT